MKESSRFLKISSAIFYGLTSFLITVVNKRILSAPFKFPSFLVLGIGQLMATIIVLYVGKKLRIIKLPQYSHKLLRSLFPLPLLYLGTMMFGLGSTQNLSLPMFSALRRFHVWLVMILEMYILKVQVALEVQLSIYAMIGGAVLAAFDDLSFNLEGYVFIMTTNVLGAVNSIYVKKELDGTDLGTYGLMFYNSLVMILPATALAWYLGDLETVYTFDEWTNPAFLIEFILGCIMGFILNYSTILCTQCNSPLTTTMVGSLKNVSVTYIGMFVGGDYIFSWANWIGLNISVAANMVYNYVTFAKKKNPQPEPDAEKLLIDKTESV